MNTLAPPSLPSSSPAPLQSEARARWRVGLVGNPNAGKTTLFNALTGLRHKVANYPGVTVEKKEGRCVLGPHDEAQIIDLPGTYSLSPSSPDEAIARDVLLGVSRGEEALDAVILVVDASNLERNLYLATQVLELGLPCVVALNMADLARAQGKSIDIAGLERELGAPVSECVAIRAQGLDALKKHIARVARAGEGRALEVELSRQSEELRQALQLELRSADREKPAHERLRCSAQSLALRLLADGEDYALGKYLPAARAQTTEKIRVLRARAEREKLDVAAEEARARHEMAQGISHRVTSTLSLKATTNLSGEALPSARSLSDRLDAVLLHPLWGGLVFALITLLVFQAIYSWSEVPKGWLEALQGVVSTRLEASLPTGPLSDLLINGAIAGVGAVVVFIPQIAVLFFFIGILEDTGYMARAALLMDRLMARVGLHGRAFIPLVSSFACAIPGVMAARTIASPRDRLATILIAPLMTCSARLPVYALMIGTFIPDNRVGPFSLRALTMLGLYAGGVVAALGMAWVFKRTILKGPPPALILELPAYKVPAWRNIVVQVWERSSQFLKRAGTVILSLSILLWFLLSYPKLGDSPEYASLNKEQASALQTQRSFAGRLGRAVEPVIAPLGFNWKIGIGLIGAMTAREVFVSTLGTVYSVADVEKDEGSLRQKMQRDRWPDGRPVWTTLSAVSLLVYFVLAMQCISTLAVVKRETNGWKWPLFMLGYMTGLAWLASFAVFQAGRALGWG